VVDAAPPKITSIDVDGAIPAGFTYTPAQHLIVHFNKPVAASQSSLNVTINSADFSLFLSAAQINTKFDVASQTALITFPDLGNTPLLDNNYTISIDSSGMSDFAGNALDGNGDGSAGDTYNGTFYVLTGDSQVGGNGAHLANRKVDFGDFQRLESNFGKIAADRPTGSDGDFNHDGTVDRLDLQILNQQYNKTMNPVPAAPVPATKPVASPAADPVAVVPSVGVTKPAPVSKPVAPVTTTPPLAAKPVAATSAAKPVVKAAKPVSTPPPPETTFSDTRVRDASDWLSGT
jgi:hypothetical protein